MDQTKAIEAKTGDIGVVREVQTLLSGWIFLQIIPSDSQNLARGGHCDHIRKGNPVLVLKTGQVIVDMDLINQVSVVLGPCNSGVFVLLFLKFVNFSRRISDFNVSIKA